MPLSRLAAFFFPITCAVCGAGLPHNDRYRLCERCRSALRPMDGLVCLTCGVPLDSGGAHCYACRSGARYGFECVRSAVRYEGAARKLIHAFKYGNRDYLARALGTSLVDCVLRHRDILAADVVVPVPMHWTKQWLRGYNQAELLARRVAADMHVPLLPRALKRCRRGKVQAALDRESRKRNVRGLIAARQPSAVRGKRILLIDDVATTCATLDACACALRAAGAHSVVCATVARD